MFACKSARVFWAILFLAVSGITEHSHARRYLDKDFESRACGSDATVDWTNEYLQDRHPFIRCDIPTPQGTKYTEFWTKPNSLSTSTIWQPNRVYSVGDRVFPTAGRETGFWYEVLSVNGDARSGAAEPSWPTYPCNEDHLEKWQRNPEDPKGCYHDDLVTDNHIVWQAWNYTGYPAAMPAGITGTNPTGAFYIAWFMRLGRFWGKDFIRLDDSSADKGCEFRGSDLSANGIRWDTFSGYWWLEDRLSPHTWTIWGGNPSVHVNPQLEVYDAYPVNQAGYNINNQPEFQYDRWYAFVMAVNLQKNNTGFFRIYVNGTKYLDYSNIATVDPNNNSARVDYFYTMGTLSQPAYDAPIQKRQYDAILITDTWQDVINGGYLRDPQIAQPADNVTPSSPRGLQVR